MPNFKFSRKLILNKLFSEITDIPVIVSTSYFSSLDGFRGIAIIAVLCCHLTYTTRFERYFVGNVGVEIFFVLSGFLITTLLLKEKVKTGRISLRLFYIRRLLRIFPVAYLYLLVLVILNYCFTLNLIPNDFLFSFLYIRNLPVNYGSGWWYTGHFWTLAIEEQFYLIFPWLLVAKLNTYIKIVILSVVIIPLLQIGSPLLQFLEHHHIGASLYPLYHAIHKFIFVISTLFGNGTNSILIGSLLSILIFKGILPSGSIRRNHFLTFFILLLAIIFRTALNSFRSDVYIIPALFSIVIAALIFLSLNSTDFLNTLLKNRLLVRTGILSYSIYVWQQLFTYNQPWKNWFPYSDSVWLNYPALIVVSYLSYYFYEKRFLILKDKFAADKQSVISKYH